MINTKSLLTLLKNANNPRLNTQIRKNSYKLFTTGNKNNVTNLVSKRSFSFSRYTFNKPPTPNPQPKVEPPKISFVNVGITILVAGAIAQLIAYVINTSAGKRDQSRAVHILGRGNSTSKLDEIESPVYGSKSDLVEAIKEIENVLGARNVRRDKSVLDVHSDSAWATHKATPDQHPYAVVTPGSTEDVSKIVQICHARRIPIVGFSGGTSLEGSFTPTRGGISVDFSRMDKLITVHDDDLDAIVQPALGWEELNTLLASRGLFFPPDPGPGACIGGMVGTSCSGTNAAHYGTVRDWILSLTVVLADGTIIKTKRRPRKSSAGYNLTNLFTGAEGTLGLVTEITVKLAPVPKFKTVAVASFESVKDAAATVSKIVRSGINPGALELLDDSAMKCINNAGATTRTWAEKPTLFFKFTGFSQTVISEQIKQVKQLAKDHNVQSFEFAKNTDEANELWSARKEALWSIQASFDPSYRVWTTDVAVPLSNLPKLIDITKKDLTTNSINSGIVGHVGDGNFHAILVYDPKDVKKVQSVVDRMVDNALALDGTCTGEHGVGLGKRDHLEPELGEPAVDTMRRIKLALDPRCIMNPDKIVYIDPKDPTIGSEN